jgi:hypothetical protein
MCIEILPLYCNNDNGDDDDDYNNNNNNNNNKFHVVKPVGAQIKH